MQCEGQQLAIDNERFIRWNCSFELQVDWLRSVSLIEFEIRFSTIVNTFVFLQDNILYEGDFVATVEFLYRQTTVTNSAKHSTSVGGSVGCSVQKLGLNPPLKLNNSGTLDTTNL